MKKETLGERVKLLRKAYGLSQSGFAQEINMSHIAIGNLERGLATNPQPDTIHSIVNKFGTTSEWLMEGKGEMLPKGVSILEQKEAPGQNIYQDTLYKELRDQIEFLRDMLRARSFHKVTNLPSLRKKRRSLVAKTA